MKTTDDILKNSLLALYADDEGIVESLKLCDYTAVNSKFRAELFQRIDEDSFFVMDTILRSQNYLNYKRAIDEAACACTTQLADLIALAMEDGGVKH
jgi:hypothetical protein